MARYGINISNALGVPLPALRKLAKEVGRNHSLAIELWLSQVHEARILATLVADPKRVTDSLMEQWVRDFDSWDICDGCCNNLFNRTPLAHIKARAWAVRDEEFVRRAGFVLIATLAVHDKKASNQQFFDYFPLIELYSVDERNLVKKAVNWALRQIGKRNMVLNCKAVELAARLKQSASRSARWIGSDAWRELTDPAICTRVKLKSI